MPASKPVSAQIITVQLISPRLLTSTRSERGRYENVCHRHCHELSSVCCGCLHLSGLSRCEVVRLINLLSSCHMHAGARVFLVESESLVLGNYL